MFGCTSWTIMKAEDCRIDAFELWCWRRLLRVPWTARRLIQSILKEISPDYSLHGLLLKLQSFGHRIWRVDSLEIQDPDAGKGWRQKKWVAEDEMVGLHHHLNGHGFEQTLGDSEGQVSLVYCSSWGHRQSDTLRDRTTNDTLLSLSTPLLGHSSMRAVIFVLFTVVS